jgi:translation elongation factor EF-1beta
LLKYLPSDDDRDRNEIKREIKNIKRKWNKRKCA